MSSAIATKKNIRDRILAKFSLYVATGAIAYRLGDTMKGDCLRHATLKRSSEYASNLHPWNCSPRNKMRTRLVVRICRQ
ncbi:hypothetical protein H6F77_04165 [Microcoleus sp. FACHB-831]|nr:hypothetical protein [Microcoleus sp. FACHB-831]